MRAPDLFFEFGGEVQRQLFDPRVPLPPQLQQ